VLFRSDNGEFTTSSAKVKLWQARAQLLSRVNATALVALSAEYQLAPAEAEAELQDFLRRASIAFGPKAAK